MEYLDFDRHLSLGIPAIDEQHREIFQLLNDLIDASETENRDKIQDTLGRIKRYTKFHFVSEERYMESSEYRDINEHSRLHNECSSKIRDIERRYKNGEDISITETIEFLRGWFLNHIKESDRLYAPETVSSSVSR